MRRQVGRFPVVPQGDGVAECTLVQGELMFSKRSGREPRRGTVVSGQVNGRVHPGSGGDSWLRMGRCARLISFGFEPLLVEDYQASEPLGGDPGSFHLHNVGPGLAPRWVRSAV